LFVAAEELRGIRLRWLLMSGCARLLPRHSLSRVRTLFYRLGGLKVGRSSLFFGPIVIWGKGDAIGRFTVGENCRINSPLYAELDADVRIGNHVSIGPCVTLITMNRDIGGPADRAGRDRPASISIEDGCWVGAGTIILPGVTLGRGSVVSAGSVVASAVLPNKLVGGVPARLIRSLSDGG
jgi:maltose O-acetyltransferase